MITELTPDVYELTVEETNGARYRVHLFDGETPTLVDAGFEHTVETVARRLDELGVTPERIVVTHGDGDHVGGLPGLADRYELESWIPRGTAIGSSYEPDHRYDDGDEIGPFTAVHTPGHTADHHALVDESSGVAVLGDAVFGSDARGLPAGYFVLPPAFYTENLNEADESLGRLLTYEFDAGLLYHGSSVTSDASAKLERFVDFRGKPE